GAVPGVQRPQVSVAAMVGRREALVPVDHSPQVLEVVLRGHEPAVEQLRTRVQLEVRDPPGRQTAETTRCVSGAVSAVLWTDDLVRPTDLVGEPVVGLEEVQLEVRHDREQLRFLGGARQAVVDHLVARGLQEAVDPAELFLGDRPLTHPSGSAGRISARGARSSPKYASTLWAGAE